MPVKKVVISVLVIGFIVSLWFNYNYYHKEKRMQLYTYNYFRSTVLSGAEALGFQSEGVHDKKQASYYIGESAMALKEWSIYQNNIGSGTKSERHIEEVANYLSYVAYYLQRPNQASEEDEEVAGEEYVKKVAQYLYDKLAENGALNDITDKNEVEVFNKLESLIPDTKLKTPSGHVDEFNF